LLIFGGKKIPELMRGMGKGVSEFKKGMKDVESEIKKDDDKA
jgi:sec-independent protein translocase protein TatA